MKIRSILTICVAAIAFAAPVYADNMSGTDMSSKPSPNPSGSVSYPFVAQNGSGETGTVTLIPAGDTATTVVIALKGAPSAAQPAHIHLGPCAKLDPKPKYPLSNVVDGKSTTKVDVPLDQLAGSVYAVNVHKSVDDLATYVACADLKTASTPKTSSGGS